MVWITSSFLLCAFGNGGRDLQMEPQAQCSGNRTAHAIWSLVVFQEGIWDAPRESAMAYKAHLR